MDGVAISIRFGKYTHMVGSKNFKLEHHLECCINCQTDLFHRTQPFVSTQCQPSRPVDFVDPAQALYSHAHQLSDVVRHQVV